MAGRTPYDDLPPASDGGRSGWPAGGLPDNLGSIALQTPDRIRRAARLVERGAVFSLNAPLGAFGHEQWGRVLVRRTVLHPPGALFFDDVLDGMALQGSSQWDSLGHVGYAPDTFYAGASEASVAGGDRNTIDHWARRGIAGRAVLLDMAGAWRDRGEVLDPASATEFCVADLEYARERARIEYEPGDILVIYTGFAEYFSQLSTAQRTGMEFVSPGLAHSEDICRYLWDSQFSAVASDNLAVEAFPADFSAENAPFGALHRMMIGQLGLALGELWWLKDLVEDCSADGRWEMLLTSAPLNVTGGIGSPANVLVLK